MWGTERGGDDLKRILNRSRRARVGGEWINDSLTSGLLVPALLSMCFS